MRAYRLNLEEPLQREQIAFGMKRIEGSEISEPVLLMDDQRRMVEQKQQHVRDKAGGSAVAVGERMDFEELSMEERRDGECVAFAARRVSRLGNLANKLIDSF